MMLAEAAHATATGPLAGLAPDRPRTATSCKIAALLHDCGKVTTPVHVVDKATKLQTIFDRIELIDTRFELLRRDAEIACCQVARRGSRASGPTAEFREFVANMEVDRELLCTCNIGSERHEPGRHRARAAIATGYRWRRRRGRGRFPHRRRAREPHHPRRHADPAGAPDHQPPHQRHDPDARALPWPRHLQNVPEYAGGHHERMDGKGYPRGLKREQM
jgi:hypothetical protein